MAEKKQSVLALLEILTHYTDEDHILSTKELLSHLDNQYDLKLERRTLYANIDLLQQSGYAISRYEDNGKGYFLEEKQFDKGEVLLLCNALHASHFISAKQSNKLIKKLLKTLSKYEAKEFKANIYLPNPLKSDNSELMYTISLISEAIRDQKMIQFTYNKYDQNKKLVARRPQPYQVEPHYIVYADGRPYLIATHPNHQDLTHYRVDRMNKAFLLDIKITKPVKESDPYEYAKNKLFMYTGETKTITCLCHNRILDHMIDIFGKDAFISAYDTDSFVLTINTSYTGAKYLAQQFLGTIEILEPADLRNEFIQELKSALSNYQK